MPGDRKRVRKKKYGKGSALKKYKRHTAQDLYKPVICYSPSVCPDVMQVRLTYSSRKTAQGGGATNIQDFIFRGNGAFDPDFATGGQQPLGYDQWANFYRRYRVIASKCVVRGTSDATIDSRITVVPMNTSSGISDRSQIIEAYMSKTVNTGQDTSQSKGYISHYMPTAVIRGGPSDIVQYEVDLSSLVTDNPANQWYWHVAGHGIGSGAVNFVIDLDIELTYYVQFYDRETLARS